MSSYPTMGSYGLNELVYEYLYKKGYTKAAQEFINEGNLSNVVITNTNEPFLQKWYKYFIETAEARHGNSFYPAQSHRIESIMISLEAQKKRHEEIIKVCGDSYEPKSGKDTKQSKKFEVGLTRISTTNLNIIISESFLIDHMLFLCDGYSISIFDLESNRVINKVMDINIKNVRVGRKISGLIFAFTTENNVINLYSLDLETFLVEKIFMMQHNNQIKNIEVINDCLYVLDVVGYVNVYGVEGMRKNKVEFETKIIYDMAGVNAETLFLVDSNNNVIKYEEEMNRCVCVDKMDIEPMLTSKNNVLFVTGSLLNMYRNDGEIKLIKSVKAAPKVIDFEMLRIEGKDIFVSLKRDEILLEDFTMGITKGHSIFGYKNNLIFISDEGTVNQFLVEIK